MTDHHDNDNLLGPEIANLKPEDMDNLKSSTASLESKAEKEKAKNEKAAEELRKLTDNDDEEWSEHRPNVSLRTILGGDILAGPWFRRQFLFILFCVFLLILYISNRYACQQCMIEIDQLQKDLLDIKYKELTRLSELQEHTRRSRVEEYLKMVNDTTLQTATNSPYILKINE